jgi:hypothetical protein
MQQKKNFCIVGYSEKKSLPLSPTKEEKLLPCGIQRKKICGLSIYRERGVLVVLPPPQVWGEDAGFTGEGRIGSTRRAGQEWRMKDPQCVGWL